MRNFVKLIFITLLIGSFSVQAESVGDTVYTCHYHRDGWMWTSGSYTGCEAIVTEKIGSRKFRIEYIRRCENFSEGQSKITSSNALFPPAAIKDNGWGIKCKSDWVSK